MSAIETSSALYRGWVRHRRFLPRPHHFRLPLFMLYLDLEEIDSVFAGRWLWSARRTALARFRREDYLGDASTTLDDSVRTLVAASLGRRPAGPIRMLTHLRYFGYIQNPVTFYYCWDDTEASPVAIVAEITNTPWGERHAYVLSEPTRRTARSATFDLRKAFHVSPFMPMEIDYAWSFGVPGEHLTVHMENRARAAGRGSSKLFDATLVLARQPIDGKGLATVLTRHPWLSARVALGIYWNAARLWAKKIPFHAHPAKRAAAAIAGSVE